VSSPPHNYCKPTCRTARRKRICDADGCGVEFVPRSEAVAAGQGRYCSVRCAAPATQARRRNGQYVTCPVCGGSRYYSNSRLAKGRRYCSPECFHIATRRYPDPEQKRCPTCSKEFRPRFPAFGDTTFCSLTCWARYRRRERPETLAPLLRTLSPKVRQKALGRLLGAQAGRLGGRPPVLITDEQRAEIANLAAMGWGRRAIAGRLQVSERAVRQAISPASTLETRTVAAKPS
jgi:hypothetical protein